MENHLPASFLWQCNSTTEKAVHYPRKISKRAISCIFWIFVSQAVNIVLHPEAGIRPVRLNEILYFPTCFFELLISPILRESPLFRAALPSQSPWEFCHRFRLRQDLPHASPGMQQLICAPGRRFHAVGPIHFPVLD